MIERNLATWLISRSRERPVVTVLGPRQAGKSTLTRACFPDKPYANLEHPGQRDHAQEDPEGFLAELSGGAIIDEIQRVPELLSYLQLMVDENPEPGRFILTGSQQLGLLGSVTQSLAGRTALTTLFPCTLDELGRFDSAPIDREVLLEVLLTGGYPSIFDQGLSPEPWLIDYIATYVERDVRQVARVGDLAAFRGFLKLCAGRTASPINLSQLASDAGISQPTARAWLSVLEASFIVFTLPAFSRNLNKRLVKRPRLHFYDTGIVCSLLGITNPQTLSVHPLRGAIFETWVASEIARAHAHRGKPFGGMHFRDSRGREVDLVLERGLSVAAIEMKAGMTVASDAFKGLKYFEGLLDDDKMVTTLNSYLVHGGNEAHRRSGVEVLPWHRAHEIEV